MQTAEETANGLFSIYNRQGAPVEIISDNGREFINSIMKTLQSTYNCKMLLSAPYHPQTNGLDESSNKTIKRYLTKMLSTKRENWHDFLEQVVLLTHSQNCCSIHIILTYHSLAKSVGTPLNIHALIVAFID